MANILENLNDLKDKAKEITDEASTIVYKKGRETKEKVENAFNGKSKADTQSKAAAEYAKQMRQQFLGGFQEGEINKNYTIEEDGLELDANRAEFNNIDKDVYEAPKKILTPTEIIESFLYNEEHDETFFDTQKDSKSKKSKEYNANSLSAGSKLKDDFLADKFNFKEKNDLLREQKVAVSDYSIERYGQLNHIINAYAGDKEELKIVGENTNSTVTERFCNILNDYMTGKSDIEKTSNNLFLEIHGVDHKKIPGDMPKDKLISLCALSELGQDATLFADRSTNEINNINNLIKNNSSINIQELILKNSIEQIFKKARTEGDQIKDLEKNDFGGNVDTLYFENDGNGTVSVFHESINDSKLVARQNADGTYQEPFMEKNLMNAIKQDRSARDDLEGRGKDALDHEIETMRNLTTREALKNPMSKAERAAYDKEQNDAIEQHNKLVNQYANQ